MTKSESHDAGPQPTLLLSGAGLARLMHPSDYLAPDGSR